MRIISKVLPIIALSVGIICGCTERNGSAIISEASLQEVDSLMIPLDSITTQSVSKMQMIGDSVLAFYNSPSGHICLYNLHKGTTDKITVFKTGPNAVNAVDGFCYVAPDSIWIYEMWGKRITLIDSEGTIKDRRKLSTENAEHAVMLYPDALTPYIVKGDKHYFQGSGSNIEGQKIGTTVIYNAKDSTVFTANPYPAVYGGPDDLFNWGVFEYRMTCYTMTPQGEMAISFPASDSIYVYNPETDSRKAYFAGYSKPTDIHLVVFKDEQGKWTNFMSQYNYSFILYDKFNNLYYRLVGIPTDDYDSENIIKEINRKPLAIIILNSDFEKVGETMLPRDCYLFAKSFVTEKGLHISVESEDDDFMKFRTFKAVK